MTPFSAYGHLLKLLLLCVAVLLCLPVAQAHATPACANMYNEAASQGLTASIVECVETEFKTKASIVRTNIQLFLNPYFMGMASIAVIMFGMKMTGGGAKLAEGVGFATRVGVAMYLFHDMGGIVSGVVSWPAEVMGMGGGTAPWGTIDDFLGRLLGVGAAYSIASGMFGLLSGAMFSSTFGLVLFFAGIKATLDIVFFIIQCIFVYLSAITMLAFLVVISPIIIPFALFYYTEKYILSWANIVAACVLTPMMLFVCLNQFIHLFEGILSDIFTILLGSDSVTKNSFDSFWRADVPAFSWLMPGDSNTNADIEASSATPLQPPAVQSNINPLMRLGVDVGVIKHAGLNFGMNTVGIIQQMVVKFAEMILLTFVVKSVIEQIPAIASQITSGASGISLAPTQIEGSIKSQINKMQAKMTGK